MPKINSITQKTKFCNHFSTVELNTLLQSYLHYLMHKLKTGQMETYKDKNPNTRTKVPLIS